ncbi:MAG: DMT family transporter [Lachnospiraceae bacterium]
MKKTAPIMIILAGTLWGSMGLFVRKLNAAGLHSMEIVSLRSVVTTLLMGIFLLCYRKELFKIRIRDLWCFVGTGVFSIVFFNYCYFKTMTFSSLSVAAVLLYTAPSFVMVFSFFLFGEKFTKTKVTALFLALAGCVLVTGILSDTRSLTVSGILTGLGAGIGYALYSVFCRYALERGYHTFTILFYTFFMASLGGIPLTDWRQIGNIAFTDPVRSGFVFVFAMVSTVLPYLLYTAGLQYVENGKASILASIEPVVATLVGIFLFRETLTWMGLTGMALVLLSIFICNRKQGVCDRRTESR